MVAFGMAGGGCGEHEEVHAPGAISQPSTNNRPCSPRWESYPSIGVTSASGLDLGHIGPANVRAMPPAAKAPFIVAIALALEKQ